MTPAPALSARLQAVADLVCLGMPVADVACDHAQLAAHLVNTGRVPSAIACDVHLGPLESAKKQLGPKATAGIDFRLGDGLKPLEPGEASTIVLAGIGCGLMLRILDARPAVVGAAQRLVLQPNTEWEQVRRHIAARKWKLAEETLCIERGRAYLTLAVNPGQADALNWTDADFELGPLLRQRRGPTFERWVLQRREVLTQLHVDLATRLGQTHQRVLMIERERERFESALQG